MLDNLIVQFTDYLRYTMKLSDNTAKAYPVDIKMALEVIDKDLENVKRKDLLIWIGELNKLYAPRTVHRKIGAMATFYNFLVDYEIVENNVAKSLPKPRIPNKIVEPDSAQSIQSILDKAKDQSLKISIKLGALCGARISEVCHLRVEDIDFTEGIITYVKSKGEKTRKVSLPSDLSTEIQKYLTTNHISDGEVVRNKQGTPFTERNLRKRFKNCLKKAGVREDMKFHDLRHFAATQYSEIGGINYAQELLGHSSIITTKNYVHNSKPRGQEIGRQVEGLLM